MFDLNILNVFETVGAFVQYEDTLAFMIGPDKSGEKLGITRLGGHIEKNESLLQALEREVKEEGSIKVKLLDCSSTFYKTKWEDISYSQITNDIIWDIKPLIIVGDKSRSTAVFLSYAEDEPKPAAESSGIIFLRKNDIIDICSKKLLLKDFLNNGGKLIKQKEIDHNLEIYAGVHLTFLYKLMQDKNELINIA